MRTVLPYLALVLIACGPTTPDATTTDASASESTTSPPTTGDTGGGDLCDPWPCNPRGECPENTMCATIKGVDVCVEPTTGALLCLPCVLASCDSEPCVDADGEFICADCSPALCDIGCPAPLSCAPCACAVDADCGPGDLVCSPGGQCVAPNDFVACGFA